MFSFGLINGKGLFESKLAQRSVTVKLGIIETKIVSLMMYRRASCGLNKHLNWKK
jgi:hypothetical protein